MPTRPSRSSLLLVVLVCLVASATAVAQTDYGISSPDSSSVPERTFQFQENTHTVDSRISVAPGDEITVEVSAPEEVYRVYLYNSDEQIVDRQSGEGDGSFTFDLTGYEPGSYAVTTYSADDGEYEAFMPVLVRGYDVEATAPASVAPDEQFDVSISVSETAASGQPASVSAVITGDNTTHTVTATGSDGEYTATVDAGDLGSGEYSVYGIAQGTDEAFGQDELLGLAESGSLTIGGAAGTDDGADDNTGDDGASGGDAAGGDGGTDAGSQTGTASDGTPTSATTASGTASPTPAEPSTADGSTDSPTTETTETESGANAAITPDGGNSTATTTEADGPGFSPVQIAMAIGILIGGLGLRRRRH